MAASLEFYRTLGLAVADGQDREEQVQIATPGGATLGLISEALMKGHDPQWIDPIGQRVTFACRCDSADEVDAVHGRVTQAGYESRQEPWDAPWGQRYAMLADPDGNRVDLFAAIAERGEE